MKPKKYWILVAMVAVVCSSCESQMSAYKNISYYPVWQKPSNLTDYPISSKTFIRFDHDMLLDPNTGELHPILDDGFMLIDIEENKEYLHFDDDMLLDPATGDLIPVLE